MSDRQCDICGDGMTRELGEPMYVDNPDFDYVHVDCANDMGIDTSL